MSAAHRLRQQNWDCPLCVAEEQCHEACASIRQQSPGSRYCLQACIGARPGDGFGEGFFESADARARSAAELDARIRRLGEELAADTRAAGPA
eukprot:CAMPEP_0204564296 /NCGR_PEP_ID=MMETSP0661-20131031/34806_1 /ASSEMBLY_ACC=CAM_ASM_000606 /TAXON_ID=109239 /ORGANISM="Alexandrium margalefi, Strain AMGDE01CS-322" /LENGTH=92 /DNA_ID=CAMNT_0051571929 /DNA_START=102 /DNA_END=380 /DNA_ORIENTATION=-